MAVLTRRSVGGLEWPSGLPKAHHTDTGRWVLVQRGREGESKCVCVCMCVCVCGDVRHGYGLLGSYKSITSGGVECQI